MPATNPIILSCPFPYALLVGKSSSRLMYTIIPATAPKRIPMMFWGIIPLSSPTKNLIAAYPIIAPIGSAKPLRNDQKNAFFLFLYT